MPRYFFHVRDGDELILDHEGLELPDLEECSTNAEVWSGRCCTKMNIEPNW